jgi:hypothetical protein
MNQSYCNDQAYIAGSFQLDDDYIVQMARLASFKIHSYKLSLVNAAFCTTREELGGIIKGSLFNYTDPMQVLDSNGFFLADMDN